MHMITFNPVIAAHGNIYGFCTSNGIMKIDSKTDKVSILHEDVILGAYGTKTGINGKLYSLPRYTNDVWEFGPFTLEMKKIIRSKTRQMFIMPAELSILTDIYAVFVNPNSILKIKFEQYKVTIPNDIYNVFFRDFY